MLDRARFASESLTRAQRRPAASSQAADIDQEDYSGQGPQPETQNGASADAGTPEAGMGKDG